MTQDAHAYLDATERLGILRSEQVAVLSTWLADREATTSAAEMERHLRTLGLITEEHTQRIGEFMGTLSELQDMDVAVSVSAPGGVDSCANMDAGGGTATVTAPPDAGLDMPLPTLGEVQVGAPNPETLAGSLSICARLGEDIAIDLPGRDAPEGTPQGPKFEVGHELGRGGMGIVQLALDRDLRREVAIKSLIEPSDKHRVRRFIEEAQVTGQLEHPNIIPIHELNLGADGRPFMVMKRVKGRSLKDVLNSVLQGRSTGLAEAVPDTLSDSNRGRRSASSTDAGRATKHSDTDVRKPATDTSLPSATRETPGVFRHMELDADTVFAERPRKALARLLHVFLKVCDAVAYAHSRGVIHRDLKPANIMVGEFGEVVLMDWGLAKVIGHPDGAATDTDVRTNRSDSEDHLGRTRYGQLMGTPVYMPPEQAAGRIDQLDERSDIYSLGAVLYAIISLNHPFEGDNVYSVVSQVTQGRLTPPSERSRAPWPVPYDLEAVVLKAMALKPAERYTSVLALKSDLEAYLAGRALAAVEYNPWELVFKWAQRNRTAVTTGLVAALLLIAAMVWFVLHVQQARDYAEDDRDRAMQAENQAKTAQRRAMESMAETDAARREVEVRFAEGLILQGDALLYGDRWREAFERYEEALTALTDLDQPTVKARLGLIDAYTRNSPQLMRMAGHEQPVADIAVTPCCNEALTASFDGMVRHWQLATGRLLHTFPVCGSGVASVLVLPDTAPRRFLCGHVDGGISLWNLDTGTEIAQEHPHAASIKEIIPGPLPGQVFTASWDGRLMLLDVETLTPLRVYEGYHGPLWSVVYLPTKGTLVAGGGGFSIDVWDVDTGEHLRSIAHTEYIFSLATTPDGTLGLVGGSENAVRVWDFTAERYIAQLPGHIGGVYSVAVSPDGRFGLSGSQDGSVRLWDLRRLETIRSYRGHDRDIFTVAFSPDGQRFLTGSIDRTAALWPVEEPHARNVFRGHLEAVTDLDVTADGRLAVSCGADGVVRVWDVATCQSVRVFSGRGAVPWKVAITRDGRQVIASGWDGNVRIWDVEAGTLVHLLSGNGIPLLGLALSPDERYLVTTDKAAQVVLWDRITGERIREYPVPAPCSDGVWDCAFTHDGRRLAVGGSDNTIVLFDVETAEVLQTLVSNVGIVFALAFSPDDTILANGGSSGDLCLLDVDSGRLVETFRGHAGYVWSIDFYRDGQYVVTGSADGTIRVWDAEEGQLVRTFMTASPDISSVIFIEGAEHMLSGSREGLIERWDFTVIEEYETFQEELPRIQRLPADATLSASDLLLVGEWYAFRNVLDWADRYLTLAQEAGASVPSASRGAILWQDGELDEALGYFEQALRGLEAAQTLDADAPVTGERLRLRLCVDGLRQTIDGQARYLELHRQAIPIEPGTLVIPAGTIQSDSPPIYSLQATAGDRYTLQLDGDASGWQLSFLFPDGTTCRDHPLSTMMPGSPQMITLPMSGDFLIIIAPVGDTQATGEMRLSLHPDNR